MTFLNALHLALVTGGFITGCATQPLVLDANHPASADAPEAATAPARSTLRADADTRRTRELLAQRERQANDAESETPVDDLKPSPNAPRTSPGPMKGKGHENH